MALPMTMVPYLRSGLGARTDDRIGDEDWGRTYWTGTDLSQNRFNNVDLSSSVFDDVDLSNSRLRDVDLSNVRIVGADVTGATIEGRFITDLLRGRVPGPPGSAGYGRTQMAPAPRRPSAWSGPAMVAVVGVGLLVLGSWMRGRRTA